MWHIQYIMNISARQVITTSLSLTVKACWKWWRSSLRKWLILYASAELLPSVSYSQLYYRWKGARLPSKRNWPIKCLFKINRSFNLFNTITSPEKLRNTSPKRAKKNISCHLPWQAGTGASQAWKPKGVFLQTAVLFPISRYPRSHAQRTRLFKCPPVWLLMDPWRGESGVLQYKAVWTDRQIADPISSLIAPLSRASCHGTFKHIGVKQP